MVVIDLGKYKTRKENPQRTTQSEKINKHKKNLVNGLFWCMPIKKIMTKKVLEKE
jgi:hypothetical protein